MCRLIQIKFRHMLATVYEFLTRLGYPHPIHPTEVHIPIGLVVGATIFRLAAPLLTRPELVRTAHHAAVLALILLAPTIVFGIMDWQYFYGGIWTRPFQVKIWLTPLLVLCVGASVVVAHRTEMKSPLVTLLYIGALVIVVVIGYFGGNIVYGGANP
jgi:uncharacterized membrane protein